MLVTTVLIIWLFYNSYRSKDVIHNQIHIISVGGWIFNENQDYFSNKFIKLVGSHGGSNLMVLITIYLLYLS